MCLEMYTKQNMIWASKLSFRDEFNSNRSNRQIVPGWPIKLVRLPLSLPLSLSLCLCLLPHSQRKEQGSPQPSCAHTPGLSALFRSAIGVSEGSVLLIRTLGTSRPHRHPRALGVLLAMCPFMQFVAWLQLFSSSGRP